jgi:hypothetical protein
MYVEVVSLLINQLVSFALLSTVSESDEAITLTITVSTTTSFVPSSALISNTSASSVNTSGATNSVDVAVLEDKLTVVPDVCDQLTDTSPSSSTAELK